MRTSTMGGIFAPAMYCAVLAAATVFSAGCGAEKQAVTAEILSGSALAAAQAAAASVADLGAARAGFRGVCTAAPVRQIIGSGRKGFPST